MTDAINPVHEHLIVRIRGAIWMTRDHIKNARDNLRHAAWCRPPYVDNRRKERARLHREINELGALRQSLAVWKNLARPGTARRKEAV
jgi:hypothetical protein